MSDSDVLVQVENVKKYFPVTLGRFATEKNTVKAVNGVSFVIKSGETFGLVGESGCGKTTIGRVILRLLDITEGSVYIRGKNVFKLSKNDLRKFRREMQVIFQDPYASLNSKMVIKDIVGEPLEAHGISKRKEREKEVEKLLDMVGMQTYYANKYPKDLSGGQRQRIGIARALALRPKLVVCDEPVSALDVSIQSQIINLLEELQEELELTYLFISHDLSVVKHICDNIGVMYLGKLVEIADKGELFDNPLHPYTQALLSAIPIPDPKTKKARIVLGGDVPSPIFPPDGCYFHPRCKYAEAICKETEPELIEHLQGHKVACHMV